MTTIFPKNIAKPGGHYSPGVLSNGILYISGQLPFSSEGEKIDGDIGTQTSQVLENMKNILETAGGRLEQVVKCTIYIVDGSHWGAVNEVYASFFGDHKPARAIVPVSELHYGFLIELEAIADLNA